MKRAFARRHKYEEKQNNGGHILQACACGQVRKIYTEGEKPPVYRQADGTWTSKKPPECKRKEGDTVTVTVKPSTPPQETKYASPRSQYPELLEMSQEELAEKVIPLVNEITEKAEVSTFDRRQKLIDLALPKKAPEEISQENIQRDTFTALNVMYEEMVAANMRTPGRYLAGRILYSYGYRAKVQELDRSHSIVMSGQNVAEKITRKTAMPGLNRI